MVTRDISERLLVVTGSGLQRSEHHLAAVSILKKNDDFLLTNSGFCTNAFMYNSMANQISCYEIEALPGTAFD